MRQMYRNNFAILFFFFTLLLYSKMHWLDMSSIARQYIHISYTDVLSNVFIVTNFTLNIFLNHLLFLTNNSHVTLSSQCIRSHSIKKYIQVLSGVQLPFLNVCAFLKCALIFYTGFPYNLDLRRATTKNDVRFYFFFSLLPKKVDLVTKM